MDEKKNDLFTVSIVAVILFAFAILDILHQFGVLGGGAALSADPRPVFTTKNLLNGNFLEEYEDYAAGHFYNGEKWARIVRNLELFWGKREFGDVYLGKQDTFFERHLTEDYEGAPVEKSLELLERLVTDYQARVMLIPSADGVWRDRLPAYGDAFDQKGYLEQVKALIGEDAYVDVLAALEAHSSEEIYYRTDPRWTSLGAYYAYYAWWEKSGKLLPYYYDLSHAETILENFVGPLPRRAGLETGGEKMIALEETLDQRVSVNYDGRVTLEGFYRPEWLDSDDPYGYFLGEEFGLMTIDTGRSRRHSLVVVGDSYANCMIPLLAPHYSTIRVVNLKYFHGNPWTLLEEQMRAGAEVLVLESVPGLLELCQEE